MNRILIVLIAAVLNGCGGGGGGNTVRVDDSMDNPPVMPGNPPNSNPPNSNPPNSNPPNSNPPVETPNDVTGVNITEGIFYSEEEKRIRRLGISWDPKPEPMNVHITGPDGFEFTATSFGASQVVPLTLPGTYTIRLARISHQGVE